MTADILKTIYEYIGVITWFVILIAAKLSFLMNKKKLSRGEMFGHFLYGLVGGIFAYFGTSSFRTNYRIIAVGIGVLAGDIIMDWIRSNIKSFLDIGGERIKKMMKK